MAVRGFLPSICCFTRESMISFNDRMNSGRVSTTIFCLDYAHMGYDHSHFRS